MPRKKKSSRRRYGKSAGKRVASAMRRKKRGTLKSGIVDAANPMIGE